MSDVSVACGRCGGDGFERVHAGVIECEACGGTGMESVINPPGEPAPRLGDALEDVLAEYREEDDA